VNAPADAALTLTLNTAVSPPTSTSSSCSARYSAIRDDPLPPLCPVFQCLPDGTETSFTSLSSNVPGIETSMHPIAASNNTPRLVTVSWTVVSLFAGMTSGDAVIVQREAAATGTGRGSSAATASIAAPATRE
jgi:hypothetical protein